jgi:bifunctional non-homologous end joining protein LigD
MPATLERTTGFVEPMLCLPSPAVPMGDDWLYEIQWEGLRVIGTKHGRTCHLHARTGEVLDDIFPEMLPALEGLECHSATIDGELIAWDEFGMPSMEELRRSGPRLLHMAVFDLPMLQGRDLREHPLIVRRAALTVVVPQGPEGMISFSRELAGEPDSLLLRAWEMRLSGIVAKRRDSLYECGERSGSWIKCRVEKDSAFFIGGFVPDGDGFEELILGERCRGGLRFVSRLGAGFMPWSRRRITEAIQPYPQRACPFVHVPELEADPACHVLDAETMRRCRWVEPRVMVEVAFSDWTPAGHLRQARFQRLVD